MGNPELSDNNQEISLVNLNQANMQKEEQILDSLSTQKNPNELFEKIKENLNNPNKVLRLLNLVENQAKKISKKENIQSYRDFLIFLTSSLNASDGQLALSVLDKRKANDIFTKLT